MQVRLMPDDTLLAQSFNSTSTRYTSMADAAIRHYEYARHEYNNTLLGWLADSASTQGRSTADIMTEDDKKTL